MSAMNVEMASDTGTMSTLSTTVTRSADQKIGSSTMRRKFSTPVHSAPTPMV